MQSTDPSDHERAGPRARASLPSPDRQRGSIETND